MPPRAPVPTDAYVPLRTHTHHSLLTGVDGPGELLRRASELGLPALAVTDVDTLAGSFELLRTFERRGDALPRPLLGAELSDPAGRAGRVVLLVENETGYRNLAKLVSARRLGDDPGAVGEDLPGPDAFDLVDALERWSAGLVVLVDHPRLVFELAERLDREHLFVALSPAGLAKPARASLGRGRQALHGHRERSRRRPLDDAPTTAASLGPSKTPPPAPAASVEELCAAARLFELATLAVPDVYFARASGHEHHRLRVAIKHNALLCDLSPTWLAERPAHLLETARLAALFRDVPDVPGPYRVRRPGRRSARALPGALARTREIGERCRYLPPLGRVLFPEVELAARDTAYSRLSSLAFDGARRRFRPLTPAVVRRLEHELSAIEELGFAPYFLLVKKIADFARDQEIPCVGRGSAADSLVAYGLELTDADPLRYELPFERFLNPARKDRPDIDLDFCWRRRDEVLAHVWGAFGAERTAMISTHATFGLRSAFREAALAEGLPPVEVNRWSRRLPWAVGRAGDGTPHDGTAEGGAVAERSLSSTATPTHPGRPDGGEGVAPPGADSSESSGALPGTYDAPGTHGTHETQGTHGAQDALDENPIARALAATPECRAFPFDDERWARVLRLAAPLIDVPRHLGLHPGGVVVAPGPITDVVSCQRAAKGVVVTQLDKDGVEAMGLVKMDLLGNRALTVIDDCLRALRARGVEPDLLAIEEDDEETAALLARGRTIGCSQVESPGMRNLLKQTAARTMDDVIQAVALIRPGPAGSGMKDAYVRRFRGLEEATPPHPRLAEALRGTHGVMLYQEDVMQAVVLMAGMDMAAADQLRRALAKHRGAELERLKRRFFEGSVANGVAPADARRVWELIANFSSFGFCKAHAVTYGRIAYRTVWLKAHHPAEFLTAFLNSETGYYEPRVYVEEARRLGVLILPPDVNRSAREFTLESGGERGASRGALRIGLGRVKGLSAGTLEALLAARAHAPFLSLPDFLTRTGAHADEAAHLIQCGAFDAFDRTRPEMLWRLHLLKAPARHAPRARPGEHALDLGALDACRTTPDERVHGARLASQGWSGPSFGVGRLELRPGEGAQLFPEPETPAFALPQLPDTDRATRGRLELELLGLSVTDHPTELFPDAVDPAERHPAFRGARLVPCAELERFRGQCVVLRGWLAASRRVRTADGRWMRFLTLEDTSGIAEAVVFPDVYERDGHHLTTRGPYHVRGTVEDQLGACTLHAEGIG